MSDNRSKPADGYLLSKRKVGRPPLPDDERRRRAKERRERERQERQRMRDAKYQPA